MTNLPKHIAIVMDGNGRWAKKRKLSRIAGHEAGADTVETIVETCHRKGIEVLTLFAFSCENWGRPTDEVEFLMELFLTVLEQQTEKLIKNNIRLLMIGNLSEFNQPLQERILKTQALTAENTGLTLVVAANYSGQWDITYAAQQISRKVLAGELSPDDLTPEIFNQFICLSDLPPLDLFIRTSGEHRISNFLLWQLAYAELYFTDVLWPDFSVDELDKALAAYAKRERRLGLTSEQLMVDD